MRFPKMRPQAAMELKVPDLAGGLNLRDGLSEVLDNQLTDCKNIWWQDGLLKTRPGIRTSQEMITYTGRPTSQSADINFFPQIKRDGCILRVTKITQIKKYAKNTVVLRFDWQGTETVKELPSFYFDSVKQDNSYFVVEKNGILYCFTSDRIIRKYTDGSDRWVEVGDDEIYCPLVLSECVASEYESQSAADVIGGGVMVEGYNLLGKSYKVQYTTFNPYIAWQEQDTENTYSTHYMRYHLPEDANNLKGKTVTVTHTNNMGIAEHKITFSITGDVASESELNGTDGLRICGAGNAIWFNQNLDDVGDVYKIKDYESGYRNNLEVIIPYSASNQEFDKIFKMTRCEWFGGGSAGGTRLFLCGNTLEKNLVVWSGLDNPLYFSENSYFYVGENSSAVTGFGKQSDMLVIFKEDGAGLYYTKYQQNTNITVSDLINQSVIDYTSSNVYFPLTQINSSVGCSYPDTIQLCRNRLVWLANGGNVYTLVSESQYNERSVFCVSEMIKRKLNKQTKTWVSSCDWNGFYCLCSDNKIYLMDYNCYGYTHIASHSKTEDANIRIPWYYWELPISTYENCLEFSTAVKICAFADKMIMANYHDSYSNAKCNIMSHALAEDNPQVDVTYYDDADVSNSLVIINKNIESLMATKLFDFGRPSVRKNVDKINLQLGNNGGEAIKVKIITECGEEEQEIVLTGAEIQSYTAGYIESKAIFPCIRQTVKIGLELSSTGVLAIDGMNFKFRLTGGSR